MEVWCMNLKKSKKVSSVLLALVLVLSIVLPSFAAYSDVNSSWAKQAIEKWSSKELINGYKDGTFKPNNSISRAEFVAIMTRVFNYQEKSSIQFKDVKPTDWFSDYVSRVKEASIIEGYPDGTFKPQDSITREQAAAIISRAFGFEASDVNACAKFSDAVKISEYAKKPVSAMVERGILQGRPGNIFAPGEKITRAEVIHIINKIIDDIANKSQTYTGNIKGSFVVNTKEVVLKDMTISGDLYIAHGVGEGNVTLDNVVVNGRTVVAGGGLGTITIKNSKLVKSVEVIKKNGKVRLLAVGSCQIPEVKIFTGAKLEEKDIAEGKTGFEKVIIKSGLESKIILAGIFEEVSVIAPSNVQQSFKNLIEAVAGSVINKLIADAPVVVEGIGRIIKAQISAANVEIAKKPEQIVITKEGITAKIEGKVIDKSSIVSDGGTGGTGGSGGDPAVQYVTVSNVRMIINGQDVATTDLRLRSNEDRFSGVKFTTNVAQSELQLTAVDTQKSGRLTADSKHAFDGTEVVLTVKQLLGSSYNGRTDVSMETLRTLAGNKIKIEGTLKGTGSFSSYQPYTTPIEIILSSDTGTLGKLTDFMAMNYNSNTKTLTATVLNDKVNVGISVYKTKAEDIIESIIGYVPNENTSNPASLSYFCPEVYLYNPNQVTTNNPPYDSLSDKADFKAALQAKYPSKTLSFASSTFGDLKGIELFVKRGDNGNIYKVLIQ